MILAEAQLKDFLKRAGRGEATLPASVIEEFSQDCTDALKKQFNRQDGWRIRMSGIGHPLCKQLLERDGHREEMAYNAIIRFLIGDMVEAALMAIMKGAGIKIVDSQRGCQLELAGETVKGTLDVILDDVVDGVKVWDIKSASPYSYSQKFGKGYDGLKADDPFGYVMQGHLYAESNDMPFGGWIVVDKSSGEVQFVTAPDDQEDDRKEYLAEANKTVAALVGGKEFKRPFKAEKETYRKGGQAVETGNTILPRMCSMCGHREHCWPKAIQHPKVTSKAKFPPLAWYDKLKVKEL